MGGECNNLGELLAHTATFPKCVVMDAENTVFLVQLYRGDGGFVTEDQLAAVTLDEDEEGHARVWAADLLHEAEGAKVPVYPVSILANR